MMGPASASYSDATTCPGSLDCALKRRAKCPPGAHACGPCLQSFQEDQQGFCVPRKHLSSGMAEYRVRGNGCVARVSSLPPSPALWVHT